MSDQEIIPKPDSSPVATALLVASCVGVLLATMLVWNELTAFYLTKRKLKVNGKAFFPPAKVNRSRKDNRPKDYYKEDFKGRSIEADLEKALSRLEPSEG